MPRPRFRFALIVAIAVLTAGSVAHYLAGYCDNDKAGHAAGLDDAYISFRYAQNLASGNGLVFNPGERVEGYSNLLFILLISPWFRFFGDGVYEISCLLNLCFISGSLLLLYRWTTDSLDRRAGAVAALLFASCPVIWVWVVSGMETPMIVFLNLGLWIAVSRSAAGSTSATRGLLPAFAVLSILARPDGILLPLLGVGYLLLARRVRPALILLAAVMATAVGVTLWRYIYYQDFVPNTYYVKVSGTLGERIRFAAALLGTLSLRFGFGPYLLTLAGVSFVGFFQFIRGVFRDRSLLALPRFECVLTLAWLAYWLYIGGDIFEDRFLVFLIPIGIFSLVRLVWERWGTRAMVGAAIAAGIVQLSVITLDPRFEYSYPKFDRWETLGMFLAREHAGEIIAIDAAGKVPFFSGLETIDMLGLNDKTIAKTTDRKAYRFEPGHNKFAPSYVLSRSPDLIATWIDPNLNLGLGLWRKRYERAGYRLRYLLNSGDRSKEHNIIDLRSTSESPVALVLRDYRYAVLEKH